MTEKACGSDQPKRKSFFGRLVDKLDKKLEEKSKKQPCCVKPKDKQKSPCC